MALNELAERREPSGLTLKDRRACALPLTLALNELAERREPSGGGLETR